MLLSTYTLYNMKIDPRDYVWHFELRLANKGDDVWRLCTRISGNLLYRSHKAAKPLLSTPCELKYFITLSCYMYMLANAGCPAGTYWNDCLEKCPCANGGICELDGSCRCPQGLTGPNCTKQGIQNNYII